MFLSKAHLSVDLHVGSIVEGCLCSSAEIRVLAETSSETSIHLLFNN
jgi:hypothetical protein